MPGSLPFGKILGIPLQINISWFVIFGVVTLSLVAGQYPSSYPWWPTSTYIIVGVATSLLFFASVIFHELAHSLVARVLGVPVKSITLFIFGGVAQIGRDAPHPRGEFIMAAAGPLSSFVLAGLFAILWAATRSLHEPTMALAGWLAWINLSLGAFNLVPGYPMDGGRVLRSLLWWATGNPRLATRIAVAFGHGIALLFIVGGVLLALLSPRNMISGLWLAFIGWFLKQAASGASRQAQFKEALSGYRAQDLMSFDAPHVLQGLTVQELVQRHVSTTYHPWFLVLQGPYLRGIVATAAIRKVPRQRWGSTYVEEIMTPTSKLGAVEPQAEALQVLEAMEEKDVGQIPVVDQGALLGVVTRNGLFRAAQMRQDLGF